MNFFDSNIEALNRKGTHFLNLSTQTSQTSLSYEGTDEEGTKWFWDQRGNPIGITSEVDTSSLPDKDLVQLIFFFGLASLEEILKVANYLNKDALFVLIEPNISVLQHALNFEDFQKLNSINYMVAAVDLEQVEDVMRAIMSTRAMLLLKKPSFYFNSYYRNKDLLLIKEYISQISKYIKHKFFRVGNSIHDSLIGLIHNMQNLSKLSDAPDVAAMKGYFSGYPAFLVSAGPSLDKNINFLKEIRDKGIIIAVDTIAERLVKNGIRPHFISSVERVKVWEYFFENKPSYYKESYIVAPPILEPNVLEAFGKRIILPMRQSVREYRWLCDVLGLSEDHKIWMGASCAHIALGFAMHIGASPIVLVGQDLAYGENITKTHALGTEYDIKPAVVPEEILNVKGYCGKEVKTQPIWNNFKIIFEERIRDSNVEVINATEGGARIKGTLQKPLREAVLEFCTQEIKVDNVIKSLPKLNFNWVTISNKMTDYINTMERKSEESLLQLKNLEDIRDRWDYYVQKGINHIFSELNKTENYFQYIPQDELLYHNLQGPLVVLLQKFHQIKSNGSLASLNQNLLIQIEFCEMFTNTCWLIAQVIKENFPWDKQNSL